MKKQLGQGMTEYIIIVALIALAAVAVYNIFGDTVRGQVGNMASELGGQAGTFNGQETTQAVNAEKTNERGLSDFGAAGSN